MAHPVRQASLQPPRPSLAASWKPPTVSQCPSVCPFHTQPVFPPASRSQITSAQRPLSSALAPCLPTLLQGSLLTGQGDGSPQEPLCWEAALGRPGCGGMPGPSWSLMVLSPAPTPSLQEGLSSASHLLGQIQSSCGRAEVL